MKLEVPDVVPLLQPDQTGLCGQTCVAMAAGVSLDEAFNAVGVTGLREPGTEVEDLRRGLRKLGMNAGEDRPWPRGVPHHVPRIPRFAIVSIEDSRTQWGHWVLIKDGFVYDPGIGWPLPVRVYEDTVIFRAYSRRYKQTRHASKRVKAKWGTVIPIYGWRKR